jgi:hypothetical protein
LYFRERHGTPAQSEPLSRALEDCPLS